MSLTPSTDATAADWISSSELLWPELVSFGPAGFPRHARLRFISDPVRVGQSENEAGAYGGTLSEAERLAIAVSVLRKHTSTPDELFFAFWDGFGFDMPAARFEVPNREFFLYSGKVAENGSWDIAVADQSPGQPWMPDPAFIWPADHTWCIANDVDPHWAGVGASSEAIAELLAEPRLDAVAAKPAEDQPHYY